MTAPERGSEPGREPLEHIRSVRETPRSAALALLRLRILRWALVGLAAALLAAVAIQIWIHRPAPRQASAPAEPAASEPDAVQSIQKFEFTSTLSGKKAYTIVADRLTGVSSGLHRLEGVRSIELVKPDGKTLKGSSDRGSFQEAEGSGKTAGQGVVVLEGHVRITGEDGEYFESERIEYLQNEKMLNSPGPCRFRLSPPSGSPSGARGAEGKAGHLQYDLDKKSARLGAGVEVTMTQPDRPDTVLHAVAAIIGEGAGSAQFSGQVEVTRQSDVLTAPAIELTRSADGEAMHMTAGPGAQGSFLPDGQTRPARFGADSIEASDPGRSGTRTLDLRGHAFIREAPEQGAAEGRSLEAPTIALTERLAPPMRTLHAEGGVVALMPAAAGESAPRRLNCASLDGTLTPAGRLQEGTAEGGVSMEAGATRALAQRAHFVGETLVELRGGRPSLQEPERSMVADELDVVAAPRQVTGRGSVRTRFTPARDQSAGPFAAGEPVQVSSDRAVLRDAPRGAEFAGSVIARQTDRALTGQTLTLNDSDRTAHADGSVSLRSFREESSASKSAPPAAPVRIPVQIDADRMTYSDAAKTSRFDGHALYREPSRRLSADTLSTAGGGADRPGEITAEGSVRFEGEGKTGRADEAVYRSEQKTIILGGKTQPAEVREIATGRTWQGPSLTCLLTADSIPVVTGDLGRSKIFGSVAGPGREQGGQSTQRRTPR